MGALLYIRYVSRIGELIIKAAIGVQYFFVGPCMCYILMRMPAVAIWFASRCHSFGGGGIREWIG